MNSNLPTIIAIGHSRPDSLRRLLGSLRKAHYPPGNVRLVISLDNSGMYGPRQVAEAFDWPFGEKRVIAHEQRLGLRNHVLSCGDLTEEYGDVIALEDDLFVSPFFYEYSTRALAFYADDPLVAGISLYGHQFNQTANLPFLPIDNGDADVYFMQLAASWGQVWSRAHWIGFRHWLEQHGTDISTLDDIPPDVRSWPESSWLKLYTAYIITLNKFFVYPYRSLSTNFGDPGQHFHIASPRFQVPIQQRSIDYQFISLNDSLAVYDAFSELLPSSIKKLNPRLAQHDFTVNLYGSKDCQSGLQLTRTRRTGLFNYQLSMKPMELSVIHDVEGEGIALIDSADLLAAGESQSRGEYEMHRFFYKFPSPRIILMGIRERLRAMFSRSRKK
jgi:hypothetical protein